MRRLGQVEAKAKGVFIESFDYRSEFMAARNALDRLAEREGRVLAYVVVPFGKLAQYQVYLMQEGYAFT